MTTITKTFDDVLRLREWGSEVIHKLPEQPSGPLLVGTSSECSLRLRDRGTTSVIAQLIFDGAHWWIRGRDTPDGLRQDGVPREHFMLTPGLELGLGATTAIAESLRTVQLRRFCQRLLGWGPDRLSAVDHALRGMRQAMARRSSLIVTGEGDLVPIAHALHRHLLRDGSPFLVCNPKRRDVEACVRSPAQCRVPENAASVWLRDVLPSVALGRLFTDAAYPCCLSDLANDAREGETTTCPSEVLDRALRSQMFSTFT